MPELSVQCCLGTRPCIGGCGVVRILKDQVTQRKKYNPLQMPKRSHWDLQDPNRGQFIDTCV